MIQNNKQSYQVLIRNKMELINNKYLMPIGKI